jgi:site-specific recombinase XerC
MRSVRRLGSIHDLRKSYGTHMAKSIPMHELKALIGYSSITVTEWFYTEPGADLAARVRAAFATTA